MPEHKLFLGKRTHHLPELSKLLPALTGASAWSLPTFHVSYLFLEPAALQTSEATSKSRNGKAVWSDEENPKTVLF